MYSANTPPVGEMPTVIVKRDLFRGLVSRRWDLCPRGAQLLQRNVDQPSTCDSSQETNADEGKISMKLAHRTPSISLRSLSCVMTLLCVHPTARSTRSIVDVKHTATEEELTRKRKVVRDFAISCRTEGAASGTSALESENDKGGSKKTRARSRARTQADNGDDEVIFALLERAEARKEELASSELSLREQQLAHDRALLEEARQRRAQDRAERLRREAQDTNAAETARVERAALTRSPEALANSKTSSVN